jgi:hypothetical protein
MFVKKKRNTKYSMPDLPTSPSMPWIFPSQRGFMNPRVAYFDSPEFRRVEFMDERGENASDQNYHNRKLEDAKAEVRARLSNNKSKERHMLTDEALPPSGRLQVVNGLPAHVGTKQREPDWDLRTSQNATRLQGGVMETKAGVDYVKQRLQGRITELNQIATGSFTPAGPQPAQEKKEEETSQVIYTILNQLNDGIVTGNIDGELVRLANTLLAKLFSDGEKLEIRDVARILDTIYKFTLDIRAVRDVVGVTPGADTKAKAVARQLMSIFERVLGVLSALNENIFASAEEKKLLLRALRPTAFDVSQEKQITDVGVSGPTLTAPGRQARETERGFFEAAETEPGQRFPTPGQPKPELEQAATTFRKGKGATFFF